MLYARLRILSSRVIISDLNLSEKIRQVVNSIGGISFKKTQFGDIEDINYYPLMKEFIEIAGKSELLKTVKDYCREHCAWLKTENDIENHAIDCLLSKAYEYWKDFPKQMSEPDKWIFYFKSIKMLERNL